jgi:hypothetical protein
MNILALDLATITGFAYGELGAAGPMAAGSTRFGKVDCTRDAMFGAALRWLNSTMAENAVDCVVFEEPLHFGLRRGRSRPGNDEVSYGLAAIVRAVAYLRKIYKVKQVRTIDVRRHFIGDNPKRDIAKRETVARCLELGIRVADDNAADAVATWFYQCALLRPELALKTTRLFNPNVKIHSVWP